MRAFADYMDTDGFKIAAMQLLRLSQRGPLCMLCAERLPRHCHRALIADYLTLQGERIIHLIAPEERQEHQLREELRRESLRVVYDRLTQTFSDLD